MSTSPSTVRFGPFRLDHRDARLWCGTEVRRLTPKAFATLELLVARAGQLVSKDEILSAIWPDVTVSEAALATCIREIRRSLGDNARQPRLIETVHRRGFRFIGEVMPDAGPGTAAIRAGTDQLPAAVVARDAEVARLRAWFTRAARGERQVAFVTGEAGIGKTTVVEAFLASLGSAEAPRVARGQCIEYHGAGEAYLPVLDALGRLCQPPGGEPIVAQLDQHAPSWLAQMPGLVSAERMEGLQRRATHATHSRMLREMAGALEAITAGQPLVLVLEDLHWSDHATLDLIAWLARRREPARLLVLSTYRPVDAIVRAHPLRALVHELVRHQRCEELPLELLPEEAIERYLTLRFPDSRIPAILSRVIHLRTDGNPLFMVTVVDALAQQGWLAEVGGRWEVRPGAEEAAAMRVPPSLAQLVEQQFEALPPEDRNVLASASVAGLEFSAAAAASGIEAADDDVESRCAELARGGQFLQAAGSETWPDGTFAGRYRFVHALYQSVVYNRLPATRRAQLHRRIGARLETGYGARAAEHAGELARHYLEGHERGRALPYLLRAGENAQGRAAYREAAAHLTQGLEVLDEMPAHRERARQELHFRTALGPLQMVLHGFAAADVERTYTRARELCLEVQDASHLVPSLWGLWQCRIVRGQTASARELADQLQEVAQREGGTTVSLLAHLAQGVTLYHVGDLTTARRHLEGAADLYRPDEHQVVALAAGQQNPGVSAYRYGASTLWSLGYPDQAAQRARRALELAQEVAHPPSIAASLVLLARLHQFLGASTPTLEYAEATVVLAREQGFAQRLAAAQILAGWAHVAHGRRDGLQAMRRGLDDFKATGAGDDIPYWLALLAATLLALGEVDAASRDLDEALAQVTATGLRVWESEIYRLKGEARLAEVGAAGRSSPRRQRGDSAAETCFLEALGVARRQQARSHELRAALSLARLWARCGRRLEAMDLLVEVRDWFTEGFDTADLTAARALLEELGGASRHSRNPGIGSRG